MSLLPGAKRAEHQQPRIPHDWYTAPVWCSEQLFATLELQGPIHDPACGEGRIVEVARRAGYETTGSDIADRGYGETGVDFLTDRRPRTTLVFNAPYKLNEEFISHGLAVASHAVVMIARVPFLCTQHRYWDLYKPCPPSLVLACSQRPSMPSGGMDIAENNTTIDYAWLVWIAQSRAGGAVALPASPACGYPPSARFSTGSRR